jgi:RNA polymerase sigma factor (sigma-70 family)
MEDPDPGAAEDQIDELTNAFAVHEALAELPENCREILDRFFARDESYRTIGQALDLPSGTIASRISRCLARLREQFGEEMTAGRRLEVDESSS